MSKPPSTSSKKEEAAAKEPDLVKAATAAPEAQWFFAWLKIAGLYLAAVTAYLGVATGLVAAWKKFSPTEGETATFTIYVLAAVLALPLFLAFLFNLLPALHRQRERNLRPGGKGEVGYFTTAPRDADPHGFFASGYESFLEWAAVPKAPLLHLTGLSGSGKSSLLGAYLKPRLASPPTGPKTTLLILRSYTDPLAAMKEELLQLWRKKPDDYDALSSIEVLRRATDGLGKGNRLLVAFDQFEEFFLIHANENKSSDAAPFGSAPGIAPLRDFLQGFLKERPKGVALVLAYREDHHRLLEPLNLPARRERVDWMAIEPLDFATATAFLKNCPGLRVPDERMERVLLEAARQEGGRVVMRPIVANLLGLVLQKMSDHPTLWRHKSDLLRHYIRHTLGDELAVDRARLLGTLVTDFHTARPRVTKALAVEVGFDATTLCEQLEYLGHAGLLRCLNPSEVDRMHHIWQIAHDFLANLIERVRDGFHRSLWRAARPWLAPISTLLVACVLVGCLGFVWPFIGKLRAIETLSKAGFTWSETEGDLLHADSSRTIFDLDNVSTAIRQLKPRKLEIARCDGLENLDGLAGISSLQILDLQRCTSLKNVGGLKGLAGLQSLHLDGCSSLQNVDGLKGLASLRELDLVGCSSLENVNGLKGLASLRWLNLIGCSSLQSMDGLMGLTGLKNLHLGKWSSQNVDGLAGLPSLQSLGLTNCPALQSVDSLKGLTKLQILDLRNCLALASVDGLAGLAQLQSLDLNLCERLPNESLDALKAALGQTSIRFPDGTTFGPAHVFPP